MKQFLTEYFSFSKKERNGIFVLISIIIALIVLIKIMPYINVDKKNDFAEFEKQLVDFEDQINYIQDRDSLNTENFDFEPFYFDPNTVSDETWRKMGLSEKTISTINNYTSKGGKFFEPNDLSKIYGFPNELFLKIKDYISIKKAVQKQYSNNYNKYEKKYDTIPYNKRTYNDTLIININTSSKEDFMNIRGLPYNLIDRIINYRDILGGFYDMEQLKDVYGMDNDIYKKISKRTIMTTDSINKISINTATFKELLKHPYLEYENVRMISNYRNDYKIKSIQDLIRNNIISSEQADKLIYYLNFDEK